MTHTPDSFAPWALVEPDSAAAPRQRAALDAALASPPPPAGWQLFVDDERELAYLSQPGQVSRGFVSGGVWVIARDQWSAQAWIAVHGLPALISFDHDYGEEALTGNGHRLARWLMERHLDGLLDLRTVRYQVHSANPTGVRNILGVLDDITRFPPGS